MLIDWFTVVAQALNFLVLVWLLKRFLYRPILDALDAREKRIAAELADASAKKAQAEQERDEFIRKNLEFDQQRAALMGHAEDEASVERERLLDEARKESDALRTKWQEGLRREHQNLSAEITNRTRDEVFAIARKTLTDLATTSLEEQITEAFLRQVRELSSEERDGLQSAFEAASTPAIVRSAFRLSTAQRRAIEDVAKDPLAIETQLQFETAPDLVSGIELTANGHKIAWSIGDYLASLKKSVDEVLKERPNPTATADTSPEQHANEQPI